MLNANKTEIGATLMALANIKQEAHHIIDQLPDNASWHDVAYQIELHASIEQGLKESDAGQTISQEELEKEYGISH
jgi:predicted transcriptional regulator